MEPGMDTLTQEDRQRIEREMERAEVEQQSREARRLIFEATAEERRRMVLAREEARELCVHRTLQEETAKAQERLATVQEELDAVEARRAEMVRRLESARLKEVVCRYQMRLRNKQVGQKRGGKKKKG
jgi:hypothetical protein